MVTSYQYLISLTANNLVDVESLRKEIIVEPGLTIQCDSASDDGTTITIKFADVLPGTQKADYLDGIITTHFGVSSLQKPSPVNVEISAPFDSKKILVNGVEKSLYKRVHGEEISVADGATVSLDHIVTYASCKFSGAMIINTAIGDSLLFKILDDDNNTYSGAPGSNYMLNQFGFDVKMVDGFYENTSNYDADLNVGMVLRCEYTNNSGSSKTIYMNVELHEVKD